MCPMFPYGNIKKIEIISLTNYDIGVRFALCTDDVFSKVYYTQNLIWTSQSRYLHNLNNKRKKQEILVMNN